MPRASSRWSTFCEQVARSARIVLGDEEDFLADFGHGLEPALEARFGAVGAGGVEVADALGVGVAQQAVEPAGAR